MRGAHGGRAPGPARRAGPRGHPAGLLRSLISQAVEDFPAALAAVRDQLPADDQPVSVLGALLGATVALCVLAEQVTPVRTVALVNPGVRIRTAVTLVEDLLRASRPPLLLIRVEQDHPAVRKDTADLAQALRERYDEPDDVQLQLNPGLAHPLADEPGLGPHPQLPATASVDHALSSWYREQLHHN